MYAPAAAAAAMPDGSDTEGPPQYGGGIIMAAAAAAAAAAGLDPTLPPDDEPALGTPLPAPPPAPPACVVDEGGDTLALGGGAPGTPGGKLDMDMTVRSAPNVDALKLEPELPEPPKKGGAPGKPPAPNPDAELPVEAPLPGTGPNAVVENGAPPIMEPGGIMLPNTRGSTQGDAIGMPAPLPAEYPPTEADPVKVGGIDKGMPKPPMGGGGGCVCAC